MKNKITFLSVLLLLLVTDLSAQRRMERLDRGVVAIRNGSSVFISWRLLGLDPSGMGFNLYRSANGGTAVKLNGSTPLTGGTNYTDNAATLTQSNRYYVRPVIGGVEQTASGSYTLVANAVNKPCFKVPLRATGIIRYVWVGDLDGDGEYDYVVDRRDTTAKRCLIEAYKKDGTFLWDVNYGPNSESTYNITPGPSTIDVGNWDGVTVFDLDGDGNAEVITKIANGVRFGDNTTWTNASNTKQWIAILNGQTGALKSYVSIPSDYIDRGSLGCSLGIGYLDGITPSIIGKFKNRNSDLSFNLMVCAFKYTGNNTSLQWKWLRGSSDAPDGHQIRIIDVDGNGTDEICDIGYCLNSNGTLRYSLGPQGVVHGDRTQIGKLDPNRAGMQGYAVQQDNPSFLLEYYYDASTGTILWKHFGTSIADVGRGIAADVNPNYSGYEVWSFSGMYNGPSNTQLTNEPDRPWPNFRIWWDGDVLSENYDNEKVDKWNYATNSLTRLLTTYHYDTAADYENNPLFYGDILGDWREEVILKGPNDASLVIFTTPIASATRIYTLPHNPAYRNCMTIKGYMQSHLTDYFLGSGMATPPVPNIYYASGTAPVVGSKSLMANNVAGLVADDNFLLSPNPLDGASLKIAMVINSTAELTFSITDMKGQLIFEKHLGEIKKGNFYTSVDLSNVNIPPGTYIASMRSKNQVHSKAFIKK